MTILAIDPGPTTSGYCAWDGERVIQAGTDVANETLITMALPALLVASRDARGITLAIERAVTYGKAPGNTVDQTIFLSGRLFEWWRLTTGQRAHCIRYAEVCLHHCGARALPESHVKQALLDRFGPVGTKVAPGVFYSVHGHAWSALALAVCVFDRLPNLQAKTA